ncbi:hypothetical protein MKX01_017605 [Papaver californicum]|nr:hypothetical protein MKX01_017605 [Papaver californicum]
MVEIQVKDADEKQQFVEEIDKDVTEIYNLISKIRYRPLSPHVLRDHIQTIEREVLTSQLMGFSDSSQLQKLFSDMELLQEDTTKLWWAGKELMRSKRLHDYVGKNEKTKILIKLEKPSLGSARKGLSYEKAS